MKTNRKTSIPFSQPLSAPKLSRLVVWASLHGPPLFIETFIRKRGRSPSYVRRGFIAYLVVDGPINPAAALYQKSPTVGTDQQKYRLQQLLEEHGITQPVLSFYIPNKTGRPPPFKRIGKVAWRQYGLQLARGAAAALAGKDQQPADMR
jgi:hypothetical protein